MLNWFSKKKKPYNVRKYERSSTKDWRDELQRGDVILSRRGKPRIVRSATYKNDRLMCVQLVIQRCSWTKRCHTTMNRSDLNWGKYRPAGFSVELSTELDKEIDKDISTCQRNLDCCDVKGFA